MATAPSEQRGSNLRLLKQFSIAPPPAVSPFVGSWDSIHGLYLLKTVLLSPVGVLRLLAVVLVVALVSGYCRLLVLCGPPVGGKLPQWVSNTGVPVIRAGSRVVLFILGVWWISTTGKADHQARVLVANHTCMLDVLVLLWLRGTSFLSKRSVLSAPLLGPICVVLQVVGVDRGSKDGKDKSKSEMSAIVENKRAPPILVFPEGTTTRSDCIMRFKPGAFAFGTSVQPVVLHWHWRWFDPSNTALTPPLLWVVQVFTQVYINITVDTLPSVHPDEQEAVNPLSFASNVRKIILSCMERRSPPSKPVHECEQSVDDFLVWKLFTQNHHPDRALALRTLSLTQVRAVVSLASPASRLAVTLPALMACGKRYLKALNPGDALLSLSRLAKLVTGVEGDPVFCSVFVQACSFPSDEMLDLRTFAVGVIILSPLTDLWGASPAYGSQDEGIRRWADLRCRLAFAALAEGKQKVIKAQAEAKLGGLVLPFEGDEADLHEFRVAIMNALVGPPAPLDASPEQLSAWQAETEAARQTTHALIEIILLELDKRFRLQTSSDLGFFLRDSELNQNVAIEMGVL